MLTNTCHPHLHQATSTHLLRHQSTTTITNINGALTLLLLICRRRRHTITTQIITTVHRHRLSSLIN
jgi:hypothetical protein